MSKSANRFAQQSRTKAKAPTRQQKMDSLQHPFDVTDQSSVVIPMPLHAPPKMVAQNTNQKSYINYLISGTKVVIAKGSAGTGKSLIAAWHATNQLKAKKVEGILLVRANVSVGKSLGMLPGTLREKLEPFFAQTLAHLATYMGKGFLKYNMDKGIIELASIEHMRGRSIENRIVIIEEAQNLTAEELEMIFTRIGDGSQMIFTGDERQTDLKGNSGLESTIALIDHALETDPDYLDNEDLEALDNDVKVVSFAPADVVRHGLCRAFVKLYYYA